MKLLIALLAVPMLFGQVPYTHTEGQLTVTAVAFDTNWIPASLPGRAPNSPHFVGTWLTVCSSDPSVVPQKSVVTFRLNGSVESRVDPLPKLSDGCTSALLRVNRSDIVSLMIVTSATVFTDIGN